MSEFQLKFLAHLYRPDGTLIGTVRAVYEDSYGPCVRWACIEEKESIGRVEIKLGAEELGGITLNESFKKGDTLVVPLSMAGMGSK
jgi:hypothetical protein